MDNRGRVDKTAGDSILIEFPNVVDAVRCAIGVARHAKRNAVTPNERRIEFRVGINLGDILIGADDIHGDGVNIAARLEGIAKLAGFASLTRDTSKCATSWTLASRTWASSRSKNIARFGRRMLAAESCHRRSKTASHGLSQRPTKYGYPSAYT